jgi:ssDNA-specific exonuclease RecJ
MKDIKEIYVIFDAHTNGYYDGSGFRGILFAKKYHLRENAVVDIGNVLTKSFGVGFLELKKVYTI